MCIFSSCWSRSDNRVWRVTGRRRWNCRWLLRIETGRREHFGITQVTFKQSGVPFRHLGPSGQTARTSRRRHVVENLLQTCPTTLDWISASQNSVGSSSRPPTIDVVWGYLFVTITRHDRVHGRCYGKHTVDGLSLSKLETLLLSCSPFCVHFPSHRTCHALQHALSTTSTPYFPVQAFASSCSIQSQTSTPVLALSSIQCVKGA